MKTNTILLAALLVALVAGGAYYFLMAEAPAEETDHTTDQMSPGVTETALTPEEKVTALERQFINEMIPHHEEAVATAQFVVDSGTQNAEVLKLATNIVAAQKAEITNMKSWYRTWYGKDYQDDGKYEPMMRNISNLTGTERDKAFLEDMIQHHLHALAMVQASAPQFIRPELKELSQNIASSQSDEVVAMKILLRQL